MATESNQTAGATGPAAPPVTPTRNRHSAGIQVSLLNGAVLELTPKEVDGLGLPTYTSCNEWPPMYGAYQPLRNGQPILTVKGDDGVTWDWRGMREVPMKIRHKQTGEVEEVEPTMTVPGYGWCKAGPLDERESNP